MKRKKLLPDVVYVYVEGEPGEQYLNAAETPNGIEDGALVGIYKLADVKKKKITETLV